MWVGADILVHTWAFTRDKEDRQYPAEWELCGGAAGPIRNQRMIDEQRKRGEPVQLVVAFRGGKGTANMVGLARAAGIEAREIK